jgi:hypothetical protein
MSSPLTLATTGSPAGADEADVAGVVSAAKAGATKAPSSTAAVVSRIFFDMFVIEVPYD